MLRQAVVVLVAALFVAGSGVALYQRLLTPVSASARTQLFEVRPGAGAATVAKLLKYKKLIRSDSAFSLYLRLHGYDRRIKAGVYAVSPQLGSRGIAEVLVEGRGMGVRLTVPEGWSIDQIAAAFDQRVPGAGARFKAYAGRPQAFSNDYRWLRRLPPKATLEGFLFPDTYVVTPGPGAAADLLRLMLARFQQVGYPIIKDGSVSNLTFLERVTLASIVEKEAVHATERPLISGVFHNRLSVQMPLGSDPTVEYALGRHQDARGLSLRDIAVESPYNTYKYPGLPPGPIANPGAASLAAAVRPARTTYMYFVAKGDGSHVFTHTYPEHLKAQARILTSRR